MTNTPTKINSIKEIAKIANCSIATVSNTLNNKGRISKEVRDNILAICKKHGYLPNSAGRNLRRRRNETVGLMFYPSSAAIFRNVFYAEIMEALEIEMDAHGYDLLLSGHNSEYNSNQPPRFLLQGKADAIIMLGRFPREHIQGIKDFGTPVMQLDGYRKKIEVDYVTTDGFAANEQIVDHLVRLGHRNIIFMAYAHEDTNASQREKGFFSAIEKHQLSKRSCISLRDFDNTNEAYQSLKRLLNSKRAPTAIIAVNDTLAAEIQQALQADGFSIPADISIFGFNDDTDSRQANPQISTVRINKQLLGKVGAAMVIKRIEKPSTPLQSFSLPVDLIHRESVAKPPR